MEKMKRILLFALALILILALAGCKDKSGSEDEAIDKPLVIPVAGSDKDGGGDSGGDKSLPLVWPKAELPPGFPEYPNGSISYVRQDKNVYGLMIAIEDTDEATFKDYVKTLEGAGWNQPKWAENTDLAVDLVKDNWWLVVGFEESFVTMIISDDYKDYSTDDKKWPEKLPYAFPEYPDGTIKILSLGDDNSVSIAMEGSSLATFKEYVKTLEKSGWKITTTYGEEGSQIVLGHLMDYKEGGWFMGIDISDDMVVSIHILLPSDDE